MAAVSKPCIHVLKEQNELRLEVDQAGIILKLVSGTAEIFGTELAVEKAYKITNRKFAVFSWNGAEISVCNFTILILFISRFF